ncbi:hypothetical protein HPO96_36355 [Kribbella sandramycini]|uniref:Uncharacterized protein n=1 Tax=Kribbella sandramycini TaxID=60450 RepID=A0A7Y4L9A3_9ACTN|nr:hypothetical protein [Kribbella sandramycini]MBB6567193.1 hypothetical protein [Kribbella sandramycini]NOL45731.1 hypothetical protein [Kribbella sandramycini]
MGNVTYGLLGPLVVRRNGIAVPFSQGHRLLATLLLHSNTPAHIGGRHVWSEVAKLRELVDPDRLPGTDGALIELSEGPYMLCLQRDELDLLRFEDLIGEAAELGDQERYNEWAAAYRSALACCRAATRLRARLG